MVIVLGLSVCLGMCVFVCVCVCVCLLWGKKEKSCTEVYVLSAELGEAFVGSA